MNLKTKTLSLDTGSIFLSQKEGRIAGPTAVFLHGWGSDHSVWVDQVKACPVPVIAIDLPGFGKSTVPSQAFSVADYADVLLAVVDKLGLKDVVLVGHSFGGQIATNLAARQPSWLTGLVLVDSASLREKQPPMLSKLGHELSPLFSLPVIRKFRPFFYKIIGADIPPENDIMKKIMRQVFRDDQRNKLSHITAPTQVIWGKDDTTTPLSEGEYIAENIPEAGLKVLPGGHFVFLDTPTAFNDTLVSFINHLT